MKPRIPSVEPSPPPPDSPAPSDSSRSPEDAIAHLEEQIFRAPRDHRAHAELAKLYRACGRDTEARGHEEAARSIRDHRPGPAPAIDPPAQRARQRRVRQARTDALVITIATHALLILVLALWVLRGKEATVPDPSITITGIAATDVPDPGSRLVESVQRRPQPILHPALPVLESPAPADLHVPPSEAVEFADSRQPEFGAPFARSGEQVSRGAGAGNAGGTVEFFGQRSHAERVVFIVDFSASMNQERRLSRLKSELYRSLASLPDGMPFNIIYYADSPWLGGAWSIESDQRAIPERVNWRVANDSERRLTSVEIANMKAEGSTYWAPPLRLALSMEPKPDLIWLLSDGDAVDRRGLTKKIRHLIDDGIRINTIGIELGGEPFQSLIDIARETGGSYSIIMGGAQHSGSEAQRFTNPTYGKAEN